MDETADQSHQAGEAPRGIALLRSALASVPARLAAIPPERAAVKPGPGRWSQKEELGHLIDSAANNHQRLVRVQLEDRLALPDYDGDKWVRVHRYQERTWQDVIETWLVMNEQLLSAAESVSHEAWSHTCTIGGSERLTLNFVMNDYVRHLFHHLRHIGLTLDDFQGEAAVPSVTRTSPALYPEKPAPADYPIHQLLALRWSPRAFEDGRVVEREKILRLIEALRWAPSCFNEQPWRYLVFDGSDPDALERARGCLAEGNAWARKAPLLMLSVAQENFAKTGQYNRHAQHDVGLASENLVLEAVDIGLVAHQMAGFDSARSRLEFGIPEDFTPMAMIAIGYPYRGKLDELPEKLRAREVGPRVRKPFGEMAFFGKWGIPYGK